MKDITPASLFGPVQDFRPPSQAHSATSKAAAESVKPRATSLREQVFRYIQAAGEQGVTDQEGIEGLPMSGDTWRPRRGELQEAGRVRDSGRTRKTKRGNEAVVWVATTNKGMI